jgi:hypothetical protein
MLSLQVGGARSLYLYFLLLLFVALSALLVCRRRLPRQCCRRCCRLPSPDDIDSQIEMMTMQGDGDDDDAGRSEEAETANHADRYHGREAETAAASATPAANAPAGQEAAAPSEPAASGVVRVHLEPEPEPKSELEACSAVGSDPTAEAPACAAADPQPGAEEESAPASVALPPSLSSPTDLARSIDIEPLRSPSQQLQSPSMSVSAVGVSVGFGGSLLGHARSPSWAASPARARVGGRIRIDPIYPDDQKPLRRLPPLALPKPSTQSTSLTHQPSE